MNLKKSSFFLSTVFFTVVAAVALLLYQHTNLIEIKAISITSSAESINASKELEIQLLRLNREALLSTLFPNSLHEVNRLRAETKIKEWLEVSKRFIGSAEEKQLIEDAERAVKNFIQVRRNLDGQKTDPVSAYLEAGHALEPALEKVNVLTELNLSQARDLGQQAESENRKANLQAILIALFCLLVFPVLWFIVRRWGYNPIKCLSQGIIEYGSKKKPVNVPVSGIKEIRDIAASFNELTEELADQRRSQLRFLAGVAHDLKNPLGAIRMSAEILSDEVQSGGEQRSIVAIIARQAVHLERMVGDLLETNRIESGELELRKQNQDIVSFLRDAVILHRSLSSLHEIDFNYDGEAIFCSFDSLRMSQVLNNILNNAIKYSPNGGRVSVGLAVDLDGVVHIQISDEGIGISEEDLPRIFEPFRRTKLTKETFPGVGLGLSVVRRILTAHGGVIKVKSRVGQGTQFTITMPIQTHATDLVNASVKNIQAKSFVGTTEY